MSKEKQPFYKFKGFLAENGIKQKYLAEKLGISQESLSQKINRSGSVFTLDEVKIICDLLEISADDFFLNKTFQKREFRLSQTQPISIS